MRDKLREIPCSDVEASKRDGRRGVEGGLRSVRPQRRWSHHNQRIVGNLVGIGRRNDAGKCDQNNKIIL